MWWMHFCHIFPSRPWQKGRRFCLARSGVNSVTGACWDMNGCRLACCCCCRGSCCVLAQLGPKKALSRRKQKSWSPSPDSINKSSATKLNNRKTKTLIWNPNTGLTPYSINPTQNGYLNHVSLLKSCWNPNLKPNHFFENYHLGFKS